MHQLDPEMMDISSSLVTSTMMNLGVVRITIWMKLRIGRILRIEELKDVS